jgi:uncharacterized damage-inducible protein DinB
MLREIQRWFRYARWANAHMFDACATLTADSFTRDMGTSFGSVHGTVEHLIGADWVWLERWHGRSPSAFANKGMHVTVDALRGAWNALDEQRTSFLATLDEDALAAPFRYRTMKGDAMEFPMGDTLLHISNHATYHRGQIIQLVKQLGGTVRSTDFILWLAESH